MSGQPARGDGSTMDFLVNLLRRLVMLLAGVAGAGLFAMVGIVCADVILRTLGYPLTGAYDLVKMAGAVAIACALPYTTAVKGHVAVEFFHQRMGPRGKVAVDTLIRLLILGFFSLLAWQLVRYGTGMRKSGEVSMSVGLPVFWLPYVMAFGCAMAVLVTLYHLFHPGKTLLKP